MSAHAGSSEMSKQMLVFIASEVHISQFLPYKVVSCIVIPFLLLHADLTTWSSQIQSVEVKQSPEYQCNSVLEVQSLLHSWNQSHLSVSRYVVLQQRGSSFQWRVLGVQTVQTVNLPCTPRRHHVTIMHNAHNASMGLHATAL